MIRKTTTLFIVFLFFVSLVSATTSQHNPPTIKKVEAAPLTEPIIDQIILQEPTIAGEYASLTIHVKNGNTVSNDVVLTISPNCDHMNVITVNIGTMEPDEGKHILLYLNYPQPGFYVGDISLTWDGGNNDYTFDADVQANPEPAAPVVYEIPDIEYEEKTVN